MVAACLSPEAGVQARWVRGNTHTHTLWSDGNAAPELVVDWYRERDYQFLVLSDHNVLSKGELRVAVEGVETRLATLDELRARFEAPGEFVLVQGEEITDEFAGRSVHVNGVNLDELVEPQGGNTLRETLNNNVDAVAAQSRRLARPMLAHVNHPNFELSLTWQDIAHVRGDRFFEVYNGHPDVRNEGDEAHPSTEEMWDLANTLRLTELGLPLLYGVATDDAHDYQSWGLGRVNPGRGWVMVRTEELSGDAVVSAMGRGDFYASSGVIIDEVRTRDGRYFIDVAAEPDVEYATQFIGTLMAADGSAVPAAIGEVLSQVRTDPAEYHFRGDELFVRAVVISSRPHPNPYLEGDLETAWLQPVEGSAPEL